MNLKNKILKAIIRNGSRFFAHINGIIFGQYYR